MTSPSNRQKKLHVSYLSPHPQVIKRLPSTPTPKLHIPEQQYTQIKDSLYSQQQSISHQLLQKLELLEHENSMFKQSLQYFNPTEVLIQLQHQLQTIKQQQAFIQQQITHCQTVQQSTTPEEYFLFKKNKRLQSFNQAIDQLFQKVNQERERMRQMIDDITQEMRQVRADVERMERGIDQRAREKATGDNRHTDRESQHPDSIKATTRLNLTPTANNQRQQMQQSRINVIVESTNSSENEYHLQNDNQNPLQSSSSSSSQPDPLQLAALQQQYKNLLQTYEIVSENNEIMTTQLFNNIQSIQDGLNKYYQSETSKLFRQLLIIKEDFSYMPIEHIVPPSTVELNYEVSPLISDYKNKLKQISNKLSTDLKKITTDILQPLKWQAITIKDYLDEPSTNNERQSLNIKQTHKSSTSYKQSQKKQQQKESYLRLTSQIQKQSLSISNMQSQLQQIMTETMIYKQKQHELELDMHNLRKKIKQQKIQNQNQQEETKQENPTMLF